MRHLSLALLFSVVLSSIEASFALPRNQSSNGSQSDYAYLLVALSKQQVDASRSWYFRKRGETGSEEIVRIFESRMQSLGFRTRVIYEATADELSAAVTAPTAQAVFWLGHSQQQATRDGLGVAPLIIDYAGNNVAALVQKIHPHIRWVGIVGCYSQPIVEEFKSQGAYTRNPLLMIHGADNREIAQKGLANSASQAVLALSTLKSRYPHRYCNESPIVALRQGEGILLDIKRLQPIVPSADSRATKDDFENTATDHHHDILYLYAEDLYLGMLASDQSEAQVWVTEHLDVSTIEIVRAGQSDLPITEISILASLGESVTWEPVRMADGKALGFNRTVYYQRKEGLVLSDQPSNCLTE